MAVVAKQARYTGTRQKVFFSIRDALLLTPDLHIIRMHTTAISSKVIRK
jgi:hypothetical protein